MVGGALLLAALWGTPITGRDLAFPLKAGQPYPAAAQRLAVAGWRRVPAPAEPEGCLPEDRRCRDHPEAWGCSSTGLGFCRFLWVNAAGHYLAVITAHGDASSGDPGLVQQWFLTDPP
ncbi:hypothetical protein [Synechococcus sp. CS-1328]|uniref:hypothetical protein n=1 Tax=Synechococcus sp. CS-1328 TaxID=2847976 RepID=UPI00223AC458|nr:hypothetical protein [Synechococcus sp. CS-1328]MCT0223657.1 hypothetical protein [Synechococcus sp. CS-1328]